MKTQSKSSAFPDTVQPGIPQLPPRPPKGWNRTPLKFDLYEEKRPIKMRDDEEYDLVTVKRGRGGVVKRERKRGADISVKTQFEVKAGDFLISKRQIVHGACGLVPAELEGSTVSNEYAVLRSRGSIDLDFLKYLSHSIYFQQTCFHSSIGVHIEKMIFKTDKWLDWDFDLPSLDEQKRIAEILGTWDRAIGATEKLIAYSEAQKKALMQQLLSGRKRLPGFNKKWQPYSLISLADSSRTNSFIDGDWIESPHIRNAGIRLIQTGNIGVGRFKDDSKRYIDQASFDELRCKEVYAGDILVCRLADPAGRSCIVPELNERAITSVDVTIFRPRADVANPTFLIHCMNQVEFLDSVRTRCGGSTRTRIARSALGNLKVSLPSIEEQLAIVNFVDGFLKHEDRLERELTALKRQKSALMQQLLTGKRRVKHITEQEEVA